LDRASFLQDGFATATFSATRVESCAMAQLIDATEGRNFINVARGSAVMRALNRHVERVFDPPRKDTHWGKRKLARDR
jgi:hypothetical protein